MTDQPEKSSVTSDLDRAHSINLPDILTIREVDGVRAELLDASMIQGPIELHGKHLSRVDAAGLQLLASFIREREQAGLSTSWADSSDQLTISAELLGISALLGLTHDQQF